MGQYLNQRDNRSELQQRIDAELREKARAHKPTGADGLPDGVDDSAYLQNTKITTSLSWAWLLIALAAIGLIGYFIYLMAR